MSSSLKEIAKQAKLRIKSGYWLKSLSEINAGLINAKENGLNESKVKSYYVQKVKNDLHGSMEEETFYLKVKEILDEFGEVSDILGRLADNEYLQTLSYEQKQRYYLDLSSKYRVALSRYKKEKEIFGNI
jgi:hypothetical protein